MSQEDKFKTSMTLFFYLTHPTAVRKFVAYVFHHLHTKEKWRKGNFVFILLSLYFNILRTTKAVTYLDVHECIICCDHYIASSTFIKHIIVTLL
jgi:hypothetical protein